MLVDPPFCTIICHARVFQDLLSTLFGNVAQSCSLEVVEQPGMEAMML